MSKFLILAILNLPFVIFGIISALGRYKDGSMGRFSLLIRLIFWLTIGAGIIFVQQIYDYLVRNDLTNSQPLSLADVILVTGVDFCLFLTIRVYTRLDHVERRLSELHEKVSISLSDKKKSDGQK